MARAAGGQEVPGEAHELRGQSARRRAAGLGDFTSDFADRRQMWRRLIAEAVGTFLLVFVAAGADVIEVAGRQPIGHSAKVVAPALMVMAMIYALGDVSGAHFNPAVTVTFAVRRAFPWARVPGYCLAQLAGALLAAGLLRAMFGLVGHLGTTRPHFGTGTSLVMETVLTATLVTIILGTASAHRIVGHNAALAVGGTIALLGLFASPISGASMNPVRSLGPAVVAGTLDDVWIYLLGPLAGALIAVGLAVVFHGPARTDEQTAAQGGG